MALTNVKMSEEVWLTCLTHALSTETEEIMGLLLGDIEYSSSGTVTALIWGASPQPRSDRQKDRVETNPEQLAAAAAQAESMTVTTGRTTRVIGWYHSHPHITVLPSHVDVKTQALYQLLDPGFVGLIFSCFNEAVADKVGRIQVLAFQATDGKPVTTPKPMSLVLANKEPTVIEIGSSSSSSDWMYDDDTSDTATTSRPKVGGRASDFGDFFADNTEANTAGRDATSGHHSSDKPSSSGKASSPVVEIDPMDMSESDSMQEAILLSKKETKAGGFLRKEVPLEVVPTSSLIRKGSPLASFKDLQRVLFEEERAAYYQAIKECTRDGKIHPLAFAHHKSNYEASLCKMIEHCLVPAINVLEDRLRENRVRIRMLDDEEAEYRAAAQRRGESSRQVQDSGTQAKDPRKMSG